MLVLIAASLIGCDPDPSSNYALDGPTHAIEAHDGTVFVSDGYGNSRIAVFSPSGKLLRSWGSKGFGQSQFNNPHALGILADGTLLVCDRDNARIQRFRPDGTYLGQWKSELLGRPWSLAIVNDTIYSLDGGDQDPGSSRAGIVQLTADGTVIKRFSGFGAAFGELNWPHSLAADQQHSLYVVDLGNHRVQRFIRDRDTFVVDAEWGRISQQYVRDPVGIAIYEDRVYVSQDEPGAPIVVLDLVTGEKLSEIGKGQFLRIHSMSFTRTGESWLVDVEADKVHRMDLQGNIQLTIGDGGVL